MINIDEINEEIHRLENCNCTTYDICKKLAILYVVRDHFSNKTMNTAPIRTTAPMTPTSTAI